MKKLIKRIFRGKYYKNGESYVDTIVKVIICVVVGSLLLTSVYAVAKSGLESAKNKVNGLLDYNPNGEDGPGGGDTSIPGGGDEPEPEEPIKPYLTFQSVNPFTIRVVSPQWDGTMEYSTDTENWTAWDGSEISDVEGRLYLRGTENTRVSCILSYNDIDDLEFADFSQFIINGTAVECVGNIETLLDWQTVVDGQHPVMDDYCFAYAFFNNSALITAPALPATTLADYCYSYMFYGCTSLTTAPELPATTLASGCYSDMFFYCTALTTAPALPATTLASACYASMFSGCTALTTVPVLPATTLAEDCYRNMFNGCTNLKVSATQTGAYQYEWRIPTEGTISSTPSGWYGYMFSGTGGTFKGSPAINTTYYLEYPPVE